jgi:hypothetical protein
MQMKRAKTQTSEGSDKEIREKDSDVRRWKSEQGARSERRGKYGQVPVSKFLSG